MRRFSIQVFIFLLLLGLAQAAYYYPLLPERVASHFGASGQPDAWSSKESFIYGYLIVMAVVTIIFLGIGFLVGKIPTSMINLPNKDYWLAAERRKETLAILSRQFIWVGSATLLLLLDIFHQSFRVQLGYAKGLEHPVASLVAYAGFAIVWSIILIGKFSRKK